MAAGGLIKYVPTYLVHRRIYLGYAWGYDLNFKRIAPLDFGPALLSKSITIHNTTKVNFKVRAYLKPEVLPSTQHCVHCCDKRHIKQIFEKTMCKDETTMSEVDFIFTVFRRYFCTQVKTYPFEGLKEPIIKMIIFCWNEQFETRKKFNLLWAIPPVDNEHFQLKKSIIFKTLQISALIPLNKIEENPINVFSTFNTTSYTEPTNSRTKKLVLR